MNDRKGRALQFSRTLKASGSVIAAAMLWSYGGAAKAQQVSAVPNASAATSAPGLQSAPDTTSEYGVDDIVVTAQKRSERVQDVPITIQVLTRRDTQKLGVKSTTDIAQFVPNVTIGLPGGVGNQPVIVIRGIGVNDFNANNSGPNGLYLDEVYLSAPAVQSSPVFDVERIEVLKGPQGTLFGMNTSGGAISLTTVKPSDAFSADASAEVSSYGTVRLEGALGGPILDGVDGRLAVVRTTSDGFMHNLLLDRRENGVDNLAIRGALRFEPAGNFSLLVNAHWNRVDNRPAEYRHIGTFAPGTQGDPAPTVCSVAQTNAGRCVDLFGYGTPAGFYDGQFNRSAHLRLNNIGGFVRAEYDLKNIVLTSLSSVETSTKRFPEDSDASPDRLLEIDPNVDSWTYTQEFRASLNTPRFKASAGVYGLYEILKQDQILRLFQDFDKYGGFGVPAGPGSGDFIASIISDRSRQRTKSYAAYAQADYRLLPRLQLTLGGRISKQDRSFDYVGDAAVQDGGQDSYTPPIPTANVSRSESNTAFSYRVALNYQPVQDIHACASIASGYKAALFNGGFLSTVPAEIDLQLQPVRPERVTAYEAGIKAGLFDRRLTIDASLFYNDYHDLQVYVLVPGVAGGLPVSVLDNAPQAHTEGLDLSIAARPFRGLTINGQLGLLRTRLDTFVADRDVSAPDYSGNRLPLAPRTSGLVSVDYQHPLFGGVVDLTYAGSYKGQQFFDVSNDPYASQDGYWIHDARISFSPHGGRFEIAAYVRNFTDRQYYAYKFNLTQPLGFIQAIVGTPRSAGLQLTARFGKN